MTRQEMYNLIVKNKWANEVLTMYGRSYSSCSNDALVAFILEKGKTTVSNAKDDKKAQVSKLSSKAEANEYYNSIVSTLRDLASLGLEQRECVFRTI